jgi:hypothetical protein
MSTVVITIEGGVIQGIISDEPVKVVIIDKDTESCEPSDLFNVAGDDVFVYKGITKSDVNIGIVAGVLKAVGRETEETQ